MRRLLILILLAVGLVLAQPGYWGPGVDADLLQGKDTAALKLVDSLDASAVVRALRGRFTTLFGATLSGNFLGGGTDSVGNILVVEAVRGRFSGNIFGDSVLANIPGANLPAMSQSARGAVPATGVPSSKFLRDDATWQAVGGSGTVTQIDDSTGLLIVLDPNPITTTGVIGVDTTAGKVVFGSPDDDAATWQGVDTAGGKAIFGTPDDNAATLQGKDSTALKAVFGAKSHAITSSTDHTSSATTGQLLEADANGLPVDATNTDAEVSAAVTASHAIQHVITATADHTSTATSGQILKADANGLPIDATNTDAEVGAAVTASHAQNTDTDLDATFEATFEKGANKGAVSGYCGLDGSALVDGDDLPALSTTKKGGAPATGTPAGKFLRDDATWQTVGGSGTVTSVSESLGIKLNPDPITTVGVVYLDTPAVHGWVTTWAGGAAADSEWVSATVVAANDTHYLGPLGDSAHAGAVRIWRKDSSGFMWGTASSAAGLYSVAFGLADTAGDAAEDTGATAVGGRRNAATGQVSTVVGGQDCRATGLLSAIVGGANNTASGIEAAIVGGYGNSTTHYSGVVGGSSNNAAGSNSGIVGGYLNRIDGASEFSGIIGGRSDTTTGHLSCVLAGIGNNALDSGSVAAGENSRPAKWEARFSNVAGTYRLTGDTVRALQAFAGNGAGLTAVDAATIQTKDTTWIKSLAGGISAADASDTARIAAHDTAEVLRAEMPDSAAVVGDAVRSEIRDTSALVANDTGDVLRAEMPDTAAAAAGDTADALRTSYAAADNAVRAEIRDTVLVVDSLHPIAISATRLRGHLMPVASATASSATPTPNADTDDQYCLTALTEAAAFAVPSGTPVNGQLLRIRILDDGTARALTWNAIYRACGVALPTTTTISKTLYIGFIYNSADTKWDCVAVKEEA